MTFDRSTLAPEWQRAFDFAEAKVGGRIVRAERQPRWRPAWFLDVERDGEIVPVYFRGARGETDHGVYSLAHEFRCMEILERHGIPVPHIYGFCDDPEGFLMAKAPGRYSLATARDEAERKAVLEHYMQILARIHALPIDDFAAAGFAKPASAAELGLGDFAHWVRAYRKTKARPEPLIEFAIDWLERNVPQGRERMSLLCGDSGQFLFDDGRVTAVIDLELSYIGDPAADLGGMLSRDLSEPMGDIGDAIRAYEAASGERVDRRVVLYHAIRFGMVTPLSTSVQVAAPNAMTDFVQYLAWYLVYARCPMQLVAHVQGVDVPDASLPDEADSEYAKGFDVLVDRIAKLSAADEFAAYQREAVARTAEYLRRADRYGAALLADDLDEAGALLGRRPRGWRERDEALEALVARSQGELDAELARYFVRRCQRHEFLLAPVMKELAGARMQTLD